MIAAFVLLPLLLPEPTVSAISKEMDQKRAYYKPSFVQFMAWFVDMQKVNFLLLRL
jgi:hypothetical protein